MEHSCKKNDKNQFQSYSFSNGSCEECEICEYQPFEYIIKIDKDNNNKFCYTVHQKIGKWPSNELEYQSDCDQLDIGHKKGDIPIIYSYENNNLDKFKKLCKIRYNHISEDFLNFVISNINNNL